MKTSIATVSVAGDLREKLTAIAAAGFDGVEIFEQDLIGFDGSARDAGNMVRDHGLEITLFQPFRDFEGLPGSQRNHAFDRAERKFDLMQELGTGLVLVGSSVSSDAVGGLDRAAADFGELGARAAKRGMRVAYLALAWGRHVCDHDDAWEIVRRADHPDVGLALNSFHTLAGKADPDSIRQIPGDRVFIVQLADAPVIEMDLRYLSRHFGVMPGQGDLDLSSFMKAVAAAGYAGPVSLEVTNDKFSNGNPRTVSLDGYRSVLNLLDRVNRIAPAPGTAAPRFPDRGEASGFEFIEYTSNEEEARIIGELLHTMGFHRTGHHISKAVSLWRQGDINIVINTEQKGFAHSAYLMHGTSVCDLGIRVKDAVDTLARARAMGAHSFSQPIGPGELSVPAIRGVGGSVLHFIDTKSDLGQIWETEFRPEKEDKAALDAGLLRIDHVAQTMNYEEMLSWSLFYTSIFRVEKSPMVDVADPAGLVRSQAIASRDGGLRFTLNGAETHRTFAGQFIADNFGSPVQHVAFASDDIFAAAARMTANGFESLAISPNYYDDIQSRFELDAALLQKMRAANILYDRDGEGEYFQLYSRPFFNGFFFEILQRKNGYTGYGARNARFRIAAQKKFQRPAGMPRK